MGAEIKKIPMIGVGIGYRSEIKEGIYDHADDIDCVEVIAENYCASMKRLDQLKKISTRYKTILHGINLSIASPFLDMTHLRYLKMVCAIANADYYSEHLCMTKTASIGLGHLAPIFYNEKMLACVIRNIKLIQDYIQKPLILENITYHVNFESDTLKQTDFFHHLVDQTGCGILLDLANLYINSENNQFDPYQFIDNLPLDHIVQVHLAGGFKNRSGIYVDSHSKAVNEPTWQLYAYLCKKALVKTVILEHDSNFPEDFSDILTQLKRAKSILKDSQHVS